MPSIHSYCSMACHPGSVENTKKTGWRSCLAHQKHMAHKRLINRQLHHIDPELCLQMCACVCVCVFGYNCCEHVHLKKVLHVCEIQDKYAPILSPIPYRSRNKKDISASSASLKRYTNFMSRKSIVWEWMSQIHSCWEYAIHCKCDYLWNFGKNKNKKFIANSSGYVWIKRNEQADERSVWRHMVKNRRLTEVQNSWLKML